MLRYTDTTVFNVGAQTIVNTINCVGVMGTGLALEFQLRFPEMEKDYVQRCQQKKVEVGRPYLYKDYGSPWILNFPTKHHWKYPSKIEWIEQGLRYFATNYERGGITSVAFPKLGCSNGGLDWHIVSSLMEEYLKDLDIDIFICEDTEKEASGTEGVMVQMLNKLEKLDWAEETCLRSDIKKKIIAATPIHRFRDLRRVEGIGKQTYNDVFSCLYSLAANTNGTNAMQQPEVENLNLFEEYEALDTQHSESLRLPSEPVKTPDDASIDVLNIKLEKPFESKSKEQHDNRSEGGTAFHIMLPHIEGSLGLGLTKEEISSRFELPKKLISDWMEEAEKLGRIKKVSRRPVRYISTSSVSSEQLECSFTS